MRSPLNPMQQHLKVIAAHDTADFAISFLENWANGLTATAPLGKPEPVSRLGPDGRVSLSQERGK